MGLDCTLDFTPVGHLNVSFVFGFPEVFVLIDYREKAQAVFSMIPKEAIDKVNITIEVKKDTYINALEEFKIRAHEAPFS